MPVQMIQPAAHEVTVVFDPASGRYFVVDSTIEGLHAEASSAIDIVMLINDRAKVLLHVPAVEIRTTLPAAGPG
ncbi:MAG TPA: hypothetical protein VIE65_22450 [Methylobacter sp.]|jgi:hypothetical protein